MEFSTKELAPERASCDCVAVAIFEDGEFSASATRLDKVSGGQLRKLARQGDLSGKLGTVRVLYDVANCASKRVLVTGVGKKEAVGAKEFTEASRKTIAALGDTGAADAWLYFTELAVNEHDFEWKARHLVMAAMEVTYRYEETKSKKSKPASLKHLVVASAAKGGSARIASGLAQGQAIGAGIALARDLGNLPGNICTPSYLASVALDMGKKSKLAVEVLERKDMEKLGMGALLSVARGSHQPPKLIVMRHNGASKSERPYVLVGKGVTFDTGGISIKPAPEMDEMKFDMCGAASVFGCMRAADAMKLKINLVGLVPATENMPGGGATKPGDIVTTLSGQTVEILNTDAEGRLILCDALTYAERFKPRAVIDIATLTGACIIALGHVCSGLFTNDESLARELLDSGNESWDRTWRLPLWEDYQEQLKSNFADFANIGGRAAGSVTAACFLARFARKLSWAHLDIAGIAWKSGKEKGATGRPIPLLTQYLMDRAR